jgi:hypothetical protein
MIDVEFVHLPTSPEGLPTVGNHVGKYHLLSVGHSIAADRATGRGCALFLAPDAIYSDGMFSRLHDLVASGKHVVLGMGPRVNEETIVPELAELGLLKDAQPLTLPPRRAVQLLLRHMHHDARVLRWSSVLFPYPPYMCIWDVGGGDGILLRSFSLHPYVLDYRHICGARPRPQDTSAVDASFIVDCAIPWDKIHQVTDSDDFIVLSLTSMHHKDYAGAPNTSPLNTLIASSQRPDISILHRSYFMNAIKMHVGDLDERWAQLEQETLRIAYNIMGAPPPALASNAGESQSAASEATAQAILTKLDAINAVLELAPRPPGKEITPADVNDALANKMIGVSGKLAAQLVVDRLLRRLSRRQ